MELAHLLDPEQEKAVRQTEGPLLIIAGAGSGKTRVLTYRVAWLLEQGVDPSRILAITFTNKATQEMKERILTMVGEPGLRIWISTFHAMCVRILRQDIESLGYKRNFTILDQDDSLKVIKRLLKERNLDEEKYKPAIVVDAIDKIKNKMGTGAGLARTAKDLFERNIASLLQSYEQYTMLHNTLDFNDLLNVTVQLFQTCPEVLERYQNRFQYIMVDEYQDTNYTQYRLVNLLAGAKGNLCVVGDEDQGIYSWRGADISNILNFERDYPGAAVIKLEQNYRSTQKIFWPICISWSILTMMWRSSASSTYRAAASVIPASVTSRLLLRKWGFLTMPHWKKPIPSRVCRQGSSKSCRSLCSNWITSVRCPLIYRSVRW